MWSILNLSAPFEQADSMRRESTPRMNKEIIISRALFLKDIHGKVPFILSSVSCPEIILLFVVIYFTMLCSTAETAKSIPENKLSLDWARYSSNCWEYLARDLSLWCFRSSHRLETWVFFSFDCFQFTRQWLPWLRLRGFLHRRIFSKRT